MRSLSNRLIGQPLLGKDEDWVFTDAAGRFDLDEIEKQAAGYWVMPDDPLRALPPAIFMRDYYEPRLGPRTSAASANPRVDCVDGHGIDLKVLHRKF